MREILFRGKRDDNGEWVISDCFFKLDNIGQCNGEIKLWDMPNRDGWVKVDTKTVGQYTGRKDKNGTKIFEGDIFGDSSRQEIDVVVFENGCFQLKSYYFAECCLDGNAYEEKWGNWNIEPLCNFNLENDEILGNIYDNPELLDVQNSN